MEDLQQARAEAIVTALERFLAEVLSQGRGRTQARKRLIEALTEMQHRSPAG